jgi:hypothetical protein
MSRYFRPEGVLYERVDGCLLLFCLGLVLLAPIFFLLEVLSEYHTVYFGPAGGVLRVISIVGLVLDELLVIVGMTAGILLLLKKGTVFTSPWWDWDCESPWWLALPLRFVYLTRSQTVFRGPTRLVSFGSGLS